MINVFLNSGISVWEYIHGINLLNPASTYKSNEIYRIYRTCQDDHLGIKFYKFDLTFAEIRVKYYWCIWYPFRREKDMIIRYYSVRVEKQLYTQIPKGKRWDFRTPSLCHHYSSQIFIYFKSTIDLYYGILARVQLM
jgi:hypothetical protein